MLARHLDARGAASIDRRVLLIHGLELRPVAGCADVTERRVPRLEARQALCRVGAEARLGMLAIVDDVDRIVELLLHDILDRLLHPAIQRRAIDCLSIVSGDELPGEVEWTREA